MRGEEQGHEVMQTVEARLCVLRLLHISTGCHHCCALMFMPCLAMPAPLQFVRLEAMEGVVAYHSGDPVAAEAALRAAEQKLARLKVGGGEGRGEGTRCRHSRFLT